MIHAITIAAFLTMKVAPPKPTAEFQRGWCAAAKTIWTNRNHNRALLGFAPETQPEAMKRIYKKWPSDPPPYQEGKSPLGVGSAQDIINMEEDAIDLYVVLPQCDWKP